MHNLKKKKSNFIALYSSACTKQG